MHKVKFELLDSFICVVGKDLPPAPTGGLRLQVGREEANVLVNNEFMLQT